MKKLIKLLLKVFPRPMLIKLSLQFGWALKLFYKGDAVECPVCEAKLRTFLPYGYVNPRDQALCPACLSLERHRLIWLYLKQETDFFTAPYKFLHIAPEQSFYKRFKKQKNLDYKTGDLFSPLADIKMDVMDIPLEDNSFDIVMCNHVFEHVEDDVKAMSEIRRILRPGGWAILQVPFDFSLDKTREDPSVTDPKERERLFGQYDHLRIYGPDYKDRLESAGFTVDPILYSNMIDPKLADRYKLPLLETLYIARK